MRSQDIVDKERKRMIASIDSEVICSVISQIYHPLSVAFVN